MAQDNVVEGDQTFTVTLSNVSSNAQLATDPTAKGTIVDDDTAPTVTDVSVTSTPVLETDTYGAGERIEVSVTFDEAVTATSDTDFVLSVAGAKRAPLVSGSGTATLVFGYTVAPGDADDNGIWIGDETRTLVGDRNGEPQAGAITSVATGVAADLTHSELGTQSGHKVDGSRTTDNTPPSFTSSAAFDAAENRTAVGTVAAADSDSDDSVTGYEITGGADMALFEIGATTGELTFKSAPDFEDPGTDNVHEVTVQATSGTGTRGNDRDPDDHGDGDRRRRAIRQAGQARAGGGRGLVDEPDRDLEDAGQERRPGDHPATSWSTGRRRAARGWTSRTPARASPRPSPG